MKRILLITIVFALCFNLKAQRVHFIYLQSDDGSSFYAKHAGEIFSSSTSGYLILSNLKDSTYIITIGFPAQTSEAKFPINVRSDKGYLLKKLGNDHSLFDMQSLELIKPTTQAVNEATPAVTRSDAFTKLLSKASNDTTLLTMPVAVKEVKEEKQKIKEENEVKVSEEPKIESSAANVETENKAVAVVEKPVELSPDTSRVIKAVADQRKDAISEPVPQNASTSGNMEEIKFKRSVVKRQSESSTTEGFGLVFLDQHHEGLDTVRILILNSKATPFTSNDNTTSQVEVVTETPVVSLAGDRKASTTKTCKQSASEKDFLKLRKNMAAETNDEAMITEAKKQFKSRCFTTEQIRNLSSLFLTNAAKYQFFDASYLHVSDSENFSSLGAELKDEYYSNRFKALIGNQ